MYLRSQAPEKVIERMNAEFKKGDSLGMAFDFVMSTHIIGEFKSSNYCVKVDKD